MGRASHSQKSLAGAAAWVVVGLQAALVVMFLLDPSDPPRGASLWQALWALAHRPSFYPLVGLAIVGAPATWIALITPGPQRGRVLLAWIVFTPPILWFFGHRIAVMISVLFTYGPRV
jgi:hypothetical protein